MAAGYQPRKVQRRQRCGKIEKPEGLQSPFQAGRYRTQCTRNEAKHAKGHCDSVYMYLHRHDEQPGPSGIKRIRLRLRFPEEDAEEGEKRTMKSSLHGPGLS